MKRSFSLLLGFLALSGCAAHSFPLSNRFGYDPQIGRDLKLQHYGILREYAFEKPQGFHGFAEYAAHPVFLEMLTNAGIGKLPAS